MKTETKIIQKPATREKTIENDRRIVSNIRKGEAEHMADLGMHFKNADDFIEHLVNL